MAIQKFKTVTRKVRFRATAFPTPAMVEIGQALVSSIGERWKGARNRFDQPVAPLSPRYAEWKRRKYGSGERNMVKTGRTLRGVRVLRAQPNTAFVGNYDPAGRQRINLNSRYQFWGVSPNDERRIAEEAAKQFKKWAPLKVESK